MNGQKAPVVSMGGTEAGGAFADGQWWWGLQIWSGFLNLFLTRFGGERAFVERVYFGFGRMGGQ